MIAVNVEKLQGKIDNCIITLVKNTLRITNNDFLNNCEL